MIIKKQLTVTPGQADLLGTGYICIKNAAEVLRMLNREPDLPYVIGTFVSGWIADLDIIQGKMDRRLNCNATFENDIKKNDTLRLMEICRLFLRFSKEQQEALEEMFIRINAGETIEVAEKEENY